MRPFIIMIGGLLLLAGLFFSSLSPAVFDAYSDLDKTIFSFFSLIMIFVGIFLLIVGYVFEKK